VRKVILAADSRIEECIKWKSPTFTYEGNLASFNPNSKKHTSLMFHTGAQIPGKFPNLQGGGGTARYMQFDTLGRVAEYEKELRAIVKAWCDSRDGDGKAPKRAGAAKSAAGKSVGAAKSAAGKGVATKSVAGTSLARPAAKKSNARSASQLHAAGKHSKKRPATKAAAKKAPAKKSPKRSRRVAK
jgi:hypothetical protein